MSRARHAFLGTLVGALLLCAGALTAEAQAQGRLQQRQQRPAEPGSVRDSLEARVRVRMGQVLRTQLGLNDTQMQQLMASNRRFEGRRMALLQQEREVRIGLRDELASRDTTRSAQVAALLDRMLAVHRDRLTLLEEEQRDLATFLTPIQRAQYFGLEEQMRRRVEELRDERMQREQRVRPAVPPNRRPPAAGARRPPAGR